MRPRRYLDALNTSLMVFCNFLLQFKFLIKFGAKFASLFINHILNLAFL